MHCIMLITIATCEIEREETGLAAPQRKRYPILSTGVGDLILKSKGQD